MTRPETVVVLLIMLVVPLAFLGSIDALPWQRRGR